MPVKKVANAKYWVGIVYPENMIPDWENEIEDVIGIPFAYCVHDKDLNKDGSVRKKHAHMILAFGNTTTYNYALSVFNKLSLPGKVCCNTCESVSGIRNKYNYLIHDTNAARKAGKYLYDPSERICGNNFDIGSYEQLSSKDKDDILMGMIELIRKNQYEDFASFMYDLMDQGLDTNQKEVIKTYSGLLERITKGNYQRHMREQSHRNF